MEQLQKHLEAANFQEAINVAFQILKEKTEAYRESAWDDCITGLSTCTLTIDGGSVQGCPFLLGSFQAVKNENAKLLQEWESNLNDSRVVTFLKRPKPLPDYYAARGTLECAQTAIAITHKDPLAIFEHAYRASRLFAGSDDFESVNALQSIQSPSVFGPDLIEECYSSLAQYFATPVGQAKDLTTWFSVPTVMSRHGSSSAAGTGKSARENSRAAEPTDGKQRRRIRVPFYSEAANMSSVATLEIEIKQGRGEFYSDPVAMAFASWDQHFQDSHKNACQFINKLGCARNGVDVLWRLLSDPPLRMLTGGSAGAAFFASLWHGLTKTPNDLSVAISAGISGDGDVLPVDHILKKIDALAATPDISTLVVSQHQRDVPDQHGELRVVKVAKVADPKTHGCDRN
jgi:hypothetical protein